MKQELEALKQQVDEIAHAPQLHNNPTPQLHTATAQPANNETEEWLQAELVEENENNAADTPHSAPVTPSAQLLSMEDIEKETIRQALERNRGNRKQTSIDLKMPERTLYRKIKEYGL